MDPVDAAPQFIEQAFDLLIQGLRLIYNYTIGMIAQALSMGPEGLPVLKLVAWVIIFVFVIWFIIRLVQALLWYFRDVIYFGLVALILAAIIVYVPNSSLPAL